MTYVTAVDWTGPRRTGVRLDLDEVDLDLRLTSRGGVATVRLAPRDAARLRDLLETLLQDAGPDR